MTDSPPLQNQECTVVILCGGRGTRLRPLTDQQPKGMVMVGGKPMLEHIINQYVRFGFNRFVICTGYHGEVIRHHFSTPPTGTTILFSHAGEDASILHRLWCARELFSPQVIVSYCDTFIDMNPQQLLAHHATTGGHVTLVTAPIRNPFGVVDSDNQGMVTRFVEKPLYDCFIGCYVMERTALQHLPPTLLALPDGDGLVAFFGQLAQTRKLAAYSHLGIQINFNTVSEHQEVEKALSRYQTCMEQE